MNSKSNDLYRSGPGFSAGQIGALADGQSKLATPDLHRLAKQGGFEAEPKGASKAASHPVADNEDKLVKHQHSKTSREKTSVAFGAKPSHAGPAARVLHKLDPRKPR